MHLPASKEFFPLVRMKLTVFISYGGGGGVRGES